MRLCKENHKFILLALCFCYTVAVLLANYSNFISTVMPCSNAEIEIEGRVYPHITEQPDTEGGTSNITVSAVNTDISSLKFSNATTVITFETDSVGNVTEDFSHMVAILHNDFLLGAGAIVGDKWILATAFQLGAFKASQLRVRVGSSSAVSGGQLLTVDQLFPHPMFRQFNNDVALLKIDKPIELNDTVRSIPVAETAPDIGDGAVLWIWSTNSSDIQRNQADILPVSECKAFYPDFDLTESNICAVLDHVLPFQVGLYGSPLVYNGSLVGLYMGMEANVYKPSLCSNLSPLVNWVYAMMKNETATQLLFPLS